MNKLIIRQLSGTQPYEPIWRAMQHFTAQRSLNPDNVTDELWLLEHQPVFTQGLAGKPEHILDNHHIPIVQSDRGGQVTYHGPGQLMCYTLFDLKRQQRHTRDFVRTLERCVIHYLKSQHIAAEYQAAAPGVYVNGAKICSIGLRVRKGYTYHGLAFNINMDLTPFQYINPCGYQGLRMTQLNQLTHCDIVQVAQTIIPIFLQEFGYTNGQVINTTLTEIIEQ